jgi:glycosyltransferase involved in cell wall biosynthesis
MPLERIHIIPFGIETKKFANSALHKSQARQLLGLPEDIFITGIIGRIDPAKGQEYLIKAIHLMHQKNRQIHALIVGEETRGDTRNYLKHLKQLTAELQMEKYIHFRPFTDKAELAFAALDIFVMASMEETFGTVTLEAMASGLPVIGTNSGGTPELLEFGKLGLLVPPRDEQELALALEVLISDNPLREKLGKDAQKRAFESFDKDLQCSSLENLLLSVTRV